MAIIATAAHAHPQNASKGKKREIEQERYRDGCTIMK